MGTSIGDRFKDAREEYNANASQGTNIRDIAKKTGISESLLSNLENEANRDVGYRKIVKLAKYYDVSLDWLLLGVGEPKRNPCAVDDLKLSVPAVNWLKQIANGPDSNRHTKYLSELLEMDEFTVLLLSLIEYFSIIKARNIGGEILEDINNLTNNLYPNEKGYFNKLAAAAKDTQYDEMEQLCIMMYREFEMAFTNEYMAIALDNDDANCTVTHLVDIYEHRIKKNFDNVLCNIRNNTK